jgi:hypothetical protein
LRTVQNDIGAGRQLQDGRELAFAQLRQQDGFSVGELKGIMTKLRHLVPEPPGNDHTSLASHLFFEGKLGAGKQTDGDVAIVGRSKTSRDRVGEACVCRLTMQIGRAGAAGTQRAIQLLLGYGLLAENTLKQLF